MKRIPLLVALVALAGVLSALVAWAESAPSQRASPARDAQPGPVAPRGPAASVPVGGLPCVVPGSVDVPAPGPSGELVGRPVGNYVFRGLDLKPWDLRRDHKGKLVLLVFWFSTCGPCREAIPHLVKLQESYGPRGLEVVGVAYEKGEPELQVAKVRAVRARYGINYTTVLAAGMDCPAKTKLGVEAFPTGVLLDEGGLVLWHSGNGGLADEPTRRHLEGEVLRRLGVPPPVIPPATPQVQPAQAGPGVVDRLVAILARTKSKDTFAVTVAALGQLGPEARVALPDIIENAERLGMLKGVLAPGGSTPAPSQMVLQAVVAIAGGTQLGYLSQGVPLLPGSIPVQEAPPVWAPPPGARSKVEPKLTGPKKRPSKTGSEDKGKSDSTSAPR